MLAINKIEDKDIGEFIKDIFITINEDTRRKGDQFGIYFYISCWFFGVLLFGFSRDVVIMNMMIFYIFYDLIAIFFIIFFYIKYSSHINKEEIFEFPSIREIICMLLFVIFIWLIIRVINIVFSPFFINLSLVNTDFYLEILSIIRIVPVEELVFRGFGMFIITEALSSFNKKQNQNITISINNREINKYKFIDNLIWVFAIFFTGIMFGLFHFFKYYDPSIFPYFYLSVNGEIFKVHIIYPMFYISLLGIFLGYCRYRFGLIASILLHTINNTFANAIIYQLSILF